MKEASHKEASLYSTARQRIVKEKVSMVGQSSTPGCKKCLHLFMALTFIISIAAACGSPSSTTNEENQQTQPIKIGASLSSAGDFSYDGKAVGQGYQLW